MAQSGPSVFLERRTYRQRRLRDAARLIPIVGAVLLLLPLLGQEGGTSDRQTTGVGIYVFGVWLGLIVFSAATARALSRRLDTGETDGARAADPEA